MSLGGQDEIYNSSDDEDYVPEGGIDEAEDEPSGDEVEEVTADEGNIVSGKRRRRGQAANNNNNNRPIAQPSSSQTEDVDAIFASLMEDDSKRLKDFKNRSGVTREASSSAEVVQTGSASEPIAASTAPISSKDSGTKTIITEVYDFAGDEVTIQREVTADELHQREEKEKKKESAAKNQPKKRSGLTGALTMLSKKPKMSVLDKSNLDWKSFKSEEKIEEELQTFNKGKHGYLSKMEFLSRSDVREFENEKAMRTNKRRL